MVEQKDFKFEENKTIKETTSKHAREIELFAIVLNFYLRGASSTGSLNDQTKDTHWLWLFLLTRSFHSLRSSISLMQKGYYAQAVVLLRMVTEAYFLCGNANNNNDIVEAILRNKPNQKDGTTRFNYKSLADGMGASSTYDKLYVFECKFSHFTNLSAGILTADIDEHNRELMLVPRYDETLFIACSEMALRNGILMSEYIHLLLSEISEEKAKIWALESKIGCETIITWLNELEAKYLTQGKDSA